MPPSTILNDIELANELFDRLRTGSLGEPQLEDVRLLDVLTELHQQDILDEILRVGDIVLGEGRPLLLVRDDSFEQPNLETWNQRLALHRAAIERTITSVGRLEIRTPFRDFVGTGFLARPNIVATNAHVVLDSFGDLTDDGPRFRTTLLGQPLGVAIDFKAEHSSTEALRTSIRDILHIEPPESDRPDLAFLRINPPAGFPVEPFQDLGSPVSGEEIVTIGCPDNLGFYVPPAQDPLGGIYKVKRVSPGLIRDIDNGILTHDASTTDGSSGSPILSLRQERIVGIHDEGTPRENRGVSADALEDLLDSLGF